MHDNRAYLKVPLQKYAASGNLPVRFRPCDHTKSQPRAPVASRLNAERDRPRKFGTHLHRTVEIKLFFNTFLREPQ